MRKCLTIPYIVVVCDASMWKWLLCFGCSISLSKPTRCHLWIQSQFHVERVMPKPITYQSEFTSDDPSKSFNSVLGCWLGFYPSLPRFLKVALFCLEHLSNAKHHQYKMQLLATVTCASAWSTCTSWWKHHKRWRCKGHNKYQCKSEQCSNYIKPPPPPARSGSLWVPLEYTVQQSMQFT